MSVVVYDLETSGVNPAADRITQFAGIRVSDDLSREIEAKEFLIRTDPDVLHSPGAAIVSRLTPGRLSAEGMPEHEAVLEMSKFLEEPGTLRTGANTINFDDEFIRHTFYRHLLDPYRAEWIGRSARMDVQALLRAASILTPSMMDEWPVNDEGEPSYRLGHSMRALGIEFDGRAHDALADAKGTLEVLRRVKERSPNIYDLGMRCARKAHVADTLAGAGWDAPKPLVLHIDRFHGNKRRCGAPVLALTPHPVIPNRTIAVDLGSKSSPEELLDMPPDRIRELLFTPKDELPQGVARPPLITIAHNASPIVLDLDEVDLIRPGSLAKTIQRILGDTGVTTEDILSRRQFMDRHGAVVADKMAAVFPEREHDELDPELSLYAGFVPDDDRKRCEGIANALSPDEARGAMVSLDDKRMKVLATRLLVMRWPDSATDAERREVMEFKDSCLRDGLGARPSLADHLKAIAELEAWARDEGDDGDLGIIAELKSAALEKAERCGWGDRGRGEGGIEL